MMTGMCMIDVVCILGLLLLLTSYLVDFGKCLHIAGYDI